MEIKYSTLLRVLVEVMLIMKLGFVKLLGSWIPMFSYAYDTYPECILYLIMTIICVLFALGISKERVGVYLRFELGVVLVIVIAGIIHGLKWNNMELMAAVSTAMPFVYLFLAYPIYILLKREYWTIDKMFDFLLFWGTMAYMLKIINCASWYFNGQVVWGNLISNANWILNGSLRINPPCMGLLIIPISYYMFINQNEKKKRKKYLLPIIVALVYSAVVHQARSILLYQIITLVAMSVFGRVSSKKKFIRYCILIIAAILVINTSFFDSFVNSFSPDNSVSGQSTVARINAIVLFASKYASHPFWGMGFLSDADKTVGAISSGMGHLDDIGMLGVFFMLGIPLFLLAILIVGRSLYVSYKTRKKYYNFSLLLFGMSMILLVTGINISWFNGIYAFAIPFYLGIVEYIKRNTNYTFIDYENNYNELI